MATAPPSPNWATLETISETKLDSISTVLDFLKAPPLASLDRSSDQTISNTTHTAVQWNSETFDTVGGHDTVTNNSRYTAQYDGIYMLSASIPWTAHANACKYEMYFKRSDGIEYNGNSIQKSTSSHTLVTSSSRLMALTTGEYVEVWVWQDSGGNRTIESSFHGGPKFDIRWVSTL